MLLLDLLKSIVKNKIVWITCKIKEKKGPLLCFFFGGGDAENNW